MSGSGEKRGMVAETPQHCRTGSGGRAGRERVEPNPGGERVPSPALRTIQIISPGVLVCSSDVCNYITRSPKHLDDHQLRQEIDMTTQLSTKIAALAVALMVNSLMIGGVAYLFSGQIHQPTLLTTMAKSSPTNAVAPTI
jgi:hypothetical protein